MSPPRYQRNHVILFGEIGQDVVALSVARGLCFGMENVTAAVWTLLDQPRTADELCAELMRQYEVDKDRCAIELADLLSEMENEGLVEQVLRPGTPL